MFFCKKRRAPDYSSSNKQFDFYGYSACIDGWNIDGYRRCMKRRDPTKNASHRGTHWEVRRYQ